MSDSPDRWIEFHIRVDPEVHLDLAAHLLMELDAGAVEERDGTLVTHEPWPPSPSESAERLRSRLQEVLPATVSVEWTPREHRDWTHLWKQGLCVRRLGDRVIIKPTWIDYEPQATDVVVEIDPGMAFGTAEHATTRGCLVLLDAAVAPGDRVLDVGTGSAILAIAAVGLGAAECLALDSDPLAVDAARENVSRNRAANVTVLLEDISPTTPSPGLFDVVVANMVSGLVLPRLDYLRGAMEPDGCLILGGTQSHERDTVLSAASHRGLVRAEEVDEDGWWAAVFRAPSHRPEPAAGFVS